MTRKPAEVLFQDILDGRQRPDWIIPPDNFVRHLQDGSVYLLDWQKKKSGFPLAGDKTWRNYRIELQVFPISKGGFLGINFHVQPDGTGACNIHFPVAASGWNEAFQSMGIWGKSCTWKLYPESQAYAVFPFGHWIQIRIDVTETFANLYVHGASKPALTLFDLPYRRGGIQFWSYYGSGYFRNLRVTQLSPTAVEPGFDNPWDVCADLNVIRTWQVTPPQRSDFGSGGIPLILYSPKTKWAAIHTDRRGVINLSRQFPKRNTKATVFAKTTIKSSEKAARILRLTYTDRLTMWCNGVEVFKGPARGWNDPNRVENFGGRLILDGYEVKVVLNTGDNTLFLRSEVTEPWGWGFWVRMG